MSLILASSSPYRRSLLARLHLPFAAESPNVDESPLPGETAAKLAHRLAAKKAEHVLSRHPDALVIGSDQVALFDDELIGKPGSHAQARAQLLRFSGRTVTFHTAVHVCDRHRSRALDVTTECDFLPLDAARIDHYLRVDQPYDTAGSAKIEQLGIALMASVRSEDPTALIGLPLIGVCRLLREFGLDPLLTPAHNES